MKKRRQEADCKPCPVEHCQVERDTEAAIFCPVHWAQLSNAEREEIAELTANEWGSKAHHRAVLSAIRKLGGE